MEKTLRERVTAKLSAIKKVLAEEQAPEAVALEDAKLIDGTIVRIEPAIEIGATVQVISEDGSLMDAPDGEHELESGDVIKVEGGVIIEIIPIEAPVEDAPVEEEMSEEAPVASLKFLKGLTLRNCTNNVNEQIERRQL
jgi:hypothetical protein